MAATLETVGADDQAAVEDLMVTDSRTSDPGAQPAPGDLDDATREAIGDLRIEFARLTERLDQAIALRRAALRQGRDADAVRAASLEDGGAFSVRSE